MPLVKLKINAKPKSGRGFEDQSPSDIIECLVDVWDDIKEALDNLTPEEADEFKEHFNKYIDGEDDLGDVLFGNADDFVARVKFLDDETQKKYTEEIVSQNVIQMEGSA